jgi:hypothetical protein
MNYVINESDGDVKVRHKKTGVTKFLPLKLVEDKMLMNRMELEAVPAPAKMEAKVTEQVESKVAEKAPAKSGKSKTE